MEVERPGQGLAAGDGPEPGRAIARAGHEHPAVGAEGRTEYGVLVLQDRPDATALGDIEELDCGHLKAEDGEILPVGAELGRGDPPGQLGEVQRPDLRPRLHGAPGEPLLAAVSDQPSAAVDEQGRGEEHGIPDRAAPLLAVRDGRPERASGIAGDGEEAGPLDPGTRSPETGPRGGTPASSPPRDAPAPGSRTCATGHPRPGRSSRRRSPGSARRR